MTQFLRRQLHLFRGLRCCHILVVGDSILLISVQKDFISGNDKGFARARLHYVEERAQYAYKEYGAHDRPRR